MRNWMSVGGISALLFGATMVLASPSYAGSSYTLSPSTVTLQPSGSRSSTAFQVTSTGSSPVAIEVRMVERQADINGEETRLDAEEQFLVYPPQILLEPGQSQTIRVSWLGDPELVSEQAYRLITEQLPIQLEEEAPLPTGPRVSISAVYNYLAAVYITPSSANPELVLDATHEMKEGADVLRLTFDNQGTAHQLLTDLSLELNVEGRTVSLSAEELVGIVGENVLAQHQRQFLLPWPDELPQGDVEASFSIR